VGSPGAAELVMLAAHNSHTEIVLTHSSQEYLWNKQKRPKKKIGTKTESSKVRLLKKCCKNEVLLYHYANVKCQNTTGSFGYEKSQDEQGGN
jgi:hypothetical protein